MHSIGCRVVCGVHASHSQKGHRRKCFDSWYCYYYYTTSKRHIFHVTRCICSALHHNDCLYVSHHLLMLEHHMRPEEQRRKSKKGQAPPSSTTHSKLPLGLTFFDLHCDLKKLACSSLASFLARKQTELVDILKTSFNKRGLFPLFACIFSDVDKFDD